MARFTFADLCEAPLGSLDYQLIAHSFHTPMIEAIPVLGPEQRNEARRLITLIDVLYDNGVGLIASAAAEPHALYVDGIGAESFARTASRLMEMRSRPISPSDIDAVRPPASRAKGGSHALAEERNCQ